MQKVYNSMQEKRTADRVRGSESRYSVQRGCRYRRGSLQHRTGKMQSGTR